MINDEHLNQLLSVLDYADQVEQDANSMRMIFQNENFSLKQELEILKGSQTCLENERTLCQVQELTEQLQSAQEENEQLLERVGSFETVERENLELSQENTELKDQLETLRKESEYYRGDLIPNLQKLSDQLKREMNAVKNENDLLRADNQSLKSTNDERLNDLEQQKSSLLERLTGLEAEKAGVSKELVD